MTDRVAKVRAFARRRLSADEFEAWINAPWTPDERAEARALLAWHLRRYPSPAARLRHAREAYARWVKTAPATSPAERGVEDDWNVTLEIE